MKLWNLNEKKQSHNKLIHHDVCVQSLSLLSSLYVSNLIIFWLFFVMLCLYNLLSLHSITNEWVKKLSNCKWYKSLLFLLSSSLRHQKLVQTIYLFFLGEIEGQSNFNCMKNVEILLFYCKKSHLFLPFLVSWSEIF